MGRSVRQQNAPQLPLFAAPSDGELTLREARALLRTGLGQKGVQCPCCQQLAKIYKRKLNSAMAYALLLIHKRFKYDDSWLHVPSFLNGFGVVARGGDWSKLVWWGLIEEKPDDRDDGAPHAGYWRITERGKQFAAAAITVSKYVYFYNGEARALSAERTNIRDALGDRFHYDELMAA